MGLLFATEIGEETKLVRCLVTVIEIRIYALPYPGAALTQILTNETA